MRSLTPFNAHWMFHREFRDEFVGDAHPGEIVRLPHNAVDLPYNYFDDQAYQRQFTYQKVLSKPAASSPIETSLVFDGAMCDAVVWVNGRQAGAHRDGYTAFEVRLTPHLNDGDNLITVRIDGRENHEIPPFGGTIDYLTYAGLYRDVWLKRVPAVAIANVKVETFDVLQAEKRLGVRVFLTNPDGLRFSGRVSATLRHASGSAIAAATSQAVGPVVELSLDGLAGLTLWDVDRPTLYEVVVELVTEHGEDDVGVAFGFREARFTPDGFILNDRKLKLRGLNRHQSYPYVGYAMGRRAQEADADILKHKLACNFVRTSHYPQSPWFLDHCDRIGLLAFEEIPGWQHIGGPQWKDLSGENVRNMIRRDWNHPSIVLWGVRINESRDAPNFYAETNRIARALDPTRQTGGVRCNANSEMLEDVYTMNDFVLGSEEAPGSNRARVALREQSEVTGLSVKVPYLVTEFAGHMYPTKRFDQEQRQAEHVTRHLQVLDAAYGDSHISGCVGWCMADYNTHKEFGSGDRICHHGVLDMFREPKYAAYVWASQGDPSNQIVMEPVSSWSRGERNITDPLPVIVLTNCEEIGLRIGKGEFKRIAPDRRTYRHLPHPPVVIDRNNVAGDALWRWSTKGDDVEIVGYIHGNVVARRWYVASPEPTTLQLEADADRLSADTKDAVRVVARALDQAGNLMRYLDDPVSIAIDGPARRLGPEVVTLKGGAVGFWIETTGEAGDIALRVASPRFPAARLAFKASLDVLRISPRPSATGAASGE